MAVHTEMGQNKRGVLFDLLGDLLRLNGLGVLGAEREVRDRHVIDLRQNNGIRKRSTRLGSNRWQVAGAGC